MSRFLVTGIVYLALTAQAAFCAGQMSIDQVDTSRLARDHVVDVYVQVSNPNGRPVADLAKMDLSLFDGSTADGNASLREVRQFSLHQGPRPGDGVTYLFLVDTAAATGPGAGSAVSAEVNPGWLETIRSALEYFLNSVDNPADRIGVATFDSRYRIDVEPTRTRADTEAAFKKMVLPAPGGKTMGAAAALGDAAEGLRGWKGRKVLVLLTGAGSLSSSSVAKELLRDQISLVAIQFGTATGDPSLQSIAKATGGRGFAAESKQELEKELLAAYTAVRGEYRLSYSPRMTPGPYRRVRVEYRGRNGTATATQQYRVGDLFAVPGRTWSPFLLIPLFAALALLVLSSRVRLRARRRGPSIEVLGALGSRTLPLVVGATTVLFDSNRATVVPGGPGDTTVRLDKGAALPLSGTITFTFDEAPRTCTMESDAAILVNNRPVRRRVLRAGDVLRIGEVTVVFDDY